MVVEKYPVAELDVVSVWDRLKTDNTAQLIDVRTRAEWTYVGVPDLARNWQAAAPDRVAIVSRQ